MFQGKLGILKNHQSFVNVLELGVCDAFHAHPLTFDIDLKLFCIAYSVSTLYDIFMLVQSTGATMFCTSEVFQKMLR